MAKKLIEFFPELTEAYGDARYALIDFDEKYGRDVKVLGVAKSPEMLKTHAGGTKRVVMLKVPVGPGSMIDRRRAEELQTEAGWMDKIKNAFKADDDDDSLAGAFARAAKAPPYKSKGQGPPVKVRVTGIVPILMMPNMAANAAASYGAKITKNLINGFEATFPDTSSFNDFKGAMTMGHLEVVKDAYRPASSKNLGWSQQVAVTQRANKQLKPRKNPDVGD